jgi:hypothetical protein
MTFPPAILLTDLCIKPSIMEHQFLGETRPKENFEEAIKNYVD